MARWKLWVVLVAFGLGCLGSHSAWGITPDDPRVKAMVEKGLSHLNSFGAQFADNRLGAHCLKALCHLKYIKRFGTRDEQKNAKNHPTVVNAIQRCASADLTHAGISSDKGTDNYSLGIAIMLICEADPQGNRPLLEKLVQELLKRQQPWGGWGYPASTTGDTSQTQYAALGMWMAQNAGVEIPQQAIESLTGWLLRTQSINGGWVYQGTDPGSYQRINQGFPTLSLSAAGLGSLYIMADLLGVRAKDADAKPEGPLVKVDPEAEAQAEREKEKRRAAPRTKNIDPARIREGIALGEGFFRANYNIEASAWQHYYMYALERYQSFREIYEGKEDQEPRWYNEGVRYLQQSQTYSDGWNGQDNSTVATSFAILFLLRSTKLAIGELALGDGVMRGGMGLPPDVSDLTETDGKINQTPLEGSTEALLAILNDPNNAQLKRLAESAQNLQLSGDITKREGEIERLRKLVSAGNNDQRKAAVALLGRSGSLDVVPSLLYALTDPDVNVVLEADRALRYISRKIGGVGLPEEMPTKDQIRAAQEAWRAWYLSVRPNAEFLD